jgi:SAM-dependent methyltransferase
MDSIPSPRASQDAPHSASDPVGVGLGGQDPLLGEPVSDPLSLYRMRDGLMAVDLLAAAVSHLNLFTWLADHPSTLGAMVVQFGIQTRPAEVLLALTGALGLTTQAGGVYHLTLRAREHLVEGSPYCLKPYYDTLQKRPQTLECLEVLRSGKPANWGSAHSAAWAQAMESDAFADEFTAAMDCRGVVLAPALARRLALEESQALLDVGGGSGVYACAMVATHPHLRAAVYEKAPVDRIAARAIGRRGYGERVEVLCGDMFAEPWPTGFDVVLLSNVVHDWDEPEVKNLLARAAAALPSGGLLVVHDAFLNAQKNGPLPVAQYSVLLMHSTEGRCYSVGEMRAWLEEVGLEWVEHHPTAVDRSYVLARKL